MATPTPHSPLQRRARLAALALSLGVAGCFSTTPASVYCTLDRSCQDGFHCDAAQKKCVPGVSVTVSPATVTIGPGASTTLLVAVGGSSNTAVQWSVQEGASAGTLTPTNVGVTFVSAGRQGLFHVVATSVADPTVSASAAVTVNPLQLTPGSATVNIGKTQQFSANGPGTWSVQEGTGGTISSTGLYTAPGAPGTYHVALTNTATSATATVTVLPAISVTITPSAPTVAAKGTVQLTATPANAPPTNAGVTWSVQETTGGSVSATGLYTAPNAGGTFHVQAVSNADPLAAAVVPVIVTPPPSVTVTPTPVALQQGKGQQFTAVVTSPPGGSSAVTWSVQEANGGSVNATGAYVAPNVAGTFHVVAALAAVPAVTGAATVTVAAGPPDATKSTVTAVAAQAGTGVHADGQESFLVTAVLKDPGGTVLPGAAIAFAPQAGLVFTPSAGSPAAAWTQGALSTASGAATAFAGSTDASGSFSVYVTSATAQTVALTGSTCFSLPCTPSGAGDLKVSLVFAATAWLPASAGIEGVSGRGITVDPANPSRLYLASTNGVFVSTDKGQTWSKPGPGLDGLDVTAVQVGAGATPLLYTTALSHRTPLGQRSSLYVSGDGGTNWTARILPQDLQFQPVLAVDPNTPGTLYIASQTLYRSTDSGLTLAPAIPAPPNGVNRQYKAIALQAGKPGSVAVLGYENSSSGSTSFLYGAADGTSFNKINAVVQGTTTSPAGPSAQALAWDPSGVLVLGGNDAKTFSSADGGATWTQKGQASATSFTVGPDKALYALCSCGTLSKSIDAGANWTNPVPGQSINGISGLAVDPSDSSRLYLSANNYAPGSGAGFAISTGGALSTSLTGLGPPTPYQALLAVDPSTPASTPAKAVQFINQTLYLTTDGGATWARSPIALPGSGDIYSLAIEQSGLDDTVRRGGLWIIRSSQAYRLAAAATAWTPITVSGFGGGFTAVRSDPVTPGTDYLLPQDASNLFVTQDGGSTWVARPLPSGVAGNTSNAFALRAVNQGGQTALYLNYRGGDQIGHLARSPDGGMSWTTFPPGTLPSYGGYYPDATDPQTFYFDVQNTLYRTRDGFKTQGIVQLLNNNNSAFAFATDPRTSGTAWAATYSPNGAVLTVTTDFGATWKKADSGIGQYTTNFSDLFFGPGVVFFNSGFHGLFRTTTNGQ